MRLAIIIIIVAGLMLGAGYFLAEFIYPLPADVAEEYLNTFVTEDFENMVKFHHSGFERPSAERLTDSFNDFSNNFSLFEIELVEFDSLEESLFEAEYQVEINYISEFFEDINIDFVMEISRDGILDWKVHWNDYLPLPEYGLGASYDRRRLYPERGSIYDRNGELLAGGGSVINIGIQPGRVEDPELLHETLYEELGLSEEYLTGEYQAEGVQDHWFVPVATVSESEFAELDPILRPIPGIFFRRQDSRVYPYDTTVGHITGYLGEVTAEMIDYYPERDYQAGERVGRSGLEIGQEEILRGKPGYEFYIETEGDRELFRQLTAVDGEDINISLDISLQNEAVDILAGERASLVLLDANSGEIIVLASTPGFDPNEFVQGISGSRWSQLTTDPDRPLFNRATQGRYPPGSTFKILTAAAALNEGIYELDSEFNDQGELTVEGNIIRNFEREVFNQHTLEDAVVRSINTTMAKVGLELGAEELENYFNSFSLSSAPDLGLPLQAGQIGNPGRSQVGLAWSAIGQDQVLISPLHMAKLFIPFANNGYAPEVTLMIDDYGYEMDQVISEETAESLQGALRKVVTDGTGRQVDLDGINIYGKTGTAEITGRDPHAWFAGFIEDFQDRDLAFALLVEEGGVGGRVAAPLVREFFERVIETGLIEELDELD